VIAAITGGLSVNRKPQSEPGSGLPVTRSWGFRSLLIVRTNWPTAGQAGAGHGLTTTESIFERNAEGWERFKADMKAHWIDGLLGYRSSEAVCGASGVNCDETVQNLRVEAKRSYRTH
jgi:hypothetical protein